MKQELKKSNEYTRLQNISLIDDGKIIDNGFSIEPNYSLFQKIKNYFKL